MSNDDAKLRDDVQLEVTNHDQPGKQQAKKKVKPNFTKSGDTTPEATAPAEAEAAAFEADAAKDARDADARDADAKPAAAVEEGTEDDDEPLPKLDSIDEAAWTAQDENHLIIDRPHEWPTQDYANDPPPRVDFRQPVRDDISSTM